MRRKKVSPRDAKRMMQRMGLNMGELPDVQEVILRTSAKEIVVENPEVAMLEMHGQKIFQVTGGKVTEKELEVAKAKRKLVIPPEDVQLVADQTGRSLEEAKNVLEETDGDLARAILLLQTRG